MAKILSFGSSKDIENEKKYKGSLISSLWDGFKSLDRFTKYQIVAVVLIALATPALTASYLILNSHAYLAPSTITPATNSPSVNLPPGKLSKIYPSGYTTTQNYTVDSEVVNLLNYINQWRSRNHLKALTPSVALTNVANWMSNDMATHNYFSHYDSLGRWICPLTSGSTTIPGRFNAITGIAYCTYYYTGEDLAAGYTTGYSTFIAFQNSPEHNAVMLGQNYTAIGLYRAYNPNSNWGWYWAVDFGNYIDGPIANYVVPPSGSTPTPTPKPTTAPTPTPVSTVSTPTPTPISSGACTPGKTRCPDGGTGYCLATYYQLCNSSGAWSDQYCTTSGYYGYATGTSGACIGQCNLHGSDLCQSSCSTPDPNLTQYTHPDYYCSTGICCSSGSTQGASATPAPTTCTPGQTQCPNGLSGYQPYSYYQVCNSNSAWSNTSCPSGYYCYSNGTSASCVAGCTTRGYSCQTSCSSGQTQWGYYCASGVCCSGTALATPTPTPASTGGYAWGYKDADKDGYGAGSYTDWPVSTSYNIVSNNTDCCDSDSRAHPGQTSGFTSPDACGSFDYNCSGSVTPTNAGGGSYYCYYGGATAYSASLNGGSSCTNPISTYSNNFYRTSTCSITSSNCGQNVTIQPCSYYYYSNQYCSGLIGYNACSTRTIACN